MRALLTGYLLVSQNRLYKYLPNTMFYIPNADRFGFYTVGSEKIYHKITALMRAKDTGQQPVWHYHSEIYGSLDWGSDRVLDLTTLYKQRAYQLREKYDWITISFSGGSDSWTLTKSFLDSNLHVDEIFVRWPISINKGNYIVSNDTSTFNRPSEWDLTIQPQLDWFAERMPHTKITVLDWSDYLFTRKFQDINWYLTQDALYPSHWLQQNSIGSGEAAAINRGLKTCVIFGRDKPQLCYKDGKIYCYFLDHLVNSIPFNNELERNVELFYWTPDFPDITWSQARAIYRYLLCNPQITELIDITRQYDRDRKFIWDNIVRGIIYEEYVQEKFFQTKKSSSLGPGAESQNWMYKFSETDWMRGYQQEWHNLISTVDDAWWNKKLEQPTSLRGFTDGWYLLGEIPQVRDRIII